LDLTCDLSLVLTGVFERMGVVDRVGVVERYKGVECCTCKFVPCGDSECPSPS